MNKGHRNNNIETSFSAPSKSNSKNYLLITAHSYNESFIVFLGPSIVTLNFLR